MDPPGMNECLADQELRSLLDGGLTEAEMSSIGDHLAECNCCRQRADDLSNVMELNWARGVRDRSSDSDAVVPQQVLEPPTGGKTAASRSAPLDLERELDWLASLASAIPIARTARSPVANPRTMIVEV